MDRAYRHNHEVMTSDRQSRSARERLAAALGLALGFAWPTSVLAHPLGEKAATGFAGGFAHPFLGLDHLAAALAVGFYAARLGGRLVWQLPAAFLAWLAAGAVLAFAGLALPVVEAGIAASLLVLGLLLAMAVRLPPAAVLSAVAAFAVFHGQAHAAEWPLPTASAGYFMGFVSATAVLHASGVLLGRCLGAYAAGSARLAGVGLMAAGGIGIFWV